MTHLEEFCETRKIKQPMRDAFMAYIRSLTAQSYSMKQGETLQKMVDNMPMNQVQDNWNRFILDVRDLLLS